MIGIGCEASISPFVGKNKNLEQLWKSATRISFKEAPHLQTMITRH
jgi:hypothetical protein